MPTGSESIAHTELAHDSEANAIGEGPCLIPMFAEPISGGMETGRVDPFQPQRLASFDGVEKIHRGSVTVPHEQKSDGLVGHVFRGEETSTSAGQVFLAP